MEGSDVAELIRLVNATYPNARPVTPLAEPVWIEDLADFPRPHVQAAFTAWRRSGHAFPPGSGDLRALVLEMARPGITFEQAWAEIHRAMKAFGRPRSAEAEDALAAVPFALDLVAAMGGWEAVCNAGPDEARPTDPGVWRAQAEHAFKALAAQRRDDEAVAELPGPRAAAAEERLAGGLTPLADIRPTWAGPVLSASAPLALPPHEPSAEPLRVLELPPQPDRADRLRMLLPPPGPAYRHGPGCVCERCMPISTETMPAEQPPGSPPRHPRRRPVRPARRR